MTVTDIAYDGKLEWAVFLACYQHWREIKTAAHIVQKSEGDIRQLNTSFSVPNIIGERPELNVSFV